MTLMMFIAVTMLSAGVALDYKANSDKPTAYRSEQLSRTLVRLTYDALANTSATRIDL